MSCMLSGRSQICLENREGNINGKLGELHVCSSVKYITKPVLSFSRKMKVSLSPLLLVVVILEILSIYIDCQADLVDLYITSRDNVLQNHSYIDYYQIGNTVSDGVQCHTDLTMHVLQLKL